MRKLHYISLIAAFTISLYITVFSISYTKDHDVSCKIYIASMKPEAVDSVDILGGVASGFIELDMPSEKIFFHLKTDAGINVSRVARIKPIINWYGKIRAIYVERVRRNPEDNERLAGRFNSLMPDETHQFSIANIGRGTWRFQTEKTNFFCEK